MIELKNVSKWYGKFQALRDCSVSVAQGEVVVFCGPSGSGKSTLIKLINGLEDFQSGDILFKSKSIRGGEMKMSELRTRVGMVFQSFELFPHLSVLRNLTIAQEKVLGRPAAEATTKALALLERVGLTSQAEKYPAQIGADQLADNAGDGGVAQGGIIERVLLDRVFETAQTWLFGAVSRLQIKNIGIFAKCA